MQPAPARTAGVTKYYIALLLWVLAFEAIGGGIGMLTAADVGGWYQSLNRAPYNPPSWAFGVVWPILYALIAIAGFRIWQRRDKPEMKLLCGLFALQMILNWGWSFIFFSLHWLWPAYLWISALVMIVAVMVILLWRHDRVSACLLLPYLLWIMFATYLSGYIAAYNL